MRRYAAVCLIIVLLFSVSACSSGYAETVDFFAMDTVMRITAYGKNAKDAVREAERGITALSNSLNAADADSDLSKFNSGASNFWSKEMDDILTTANRASEMTDGAFDVRVYPVVEAWGFFSGEYRVPGEDEMKRLLSERDMLDFGGIAKGYASDLAAELMREKNIKSAVIALGGNIYAIGKNPDGRPWRIAVQDPFDPEEYSGVLSLSDKAAVTSGAYQRYFEYDGAIYHHIIDPHTGYPASSGLSSVTVISSDGTLADALSTGLFVLGLERAIEVWQSNSGLFDLVLIDDDGRIFITAGLSGKFESENNFEVVS